MSYLFRSMLFVPAYNEKFISKAVDCRADAIIFDLEDSCPLEKEPEGRELICRFLESGVFAGRQLIIRINELGTESLSKDLELLYIRACWGLCRPRSAARRKCERLTALYPKKRKNMDW